MRESILAVKRKLLVKEAKRFKEVHELLGENNEILVRNLLEKEKKFKGNWGLCFMQHCIEAVDDFCDEFYPGHNRCEIDMQTDMLHMWKNMSRLNKKAKPEVGDVLIMHYKKRGKLLTSGQLGVITEANRDLTLKTIEGNIPNHFENEPMAQQKVGIHERSRYHKTLPSINFLGYFSPWTDR